MPDDFLDEMEAALKGIPYKRKTPTNLRGAKSLSQDDLEEVLRSAGWNEKHIPKMSAIGMAESALDKQGRAKIDSYNPGVGAGGRPTVEQSIGNWQINMHPSLGRKYDRGKLASDPVYNAKAALDIFKTQGFNAWGAHSDGRYRKFFRGVASPRREAEPQKPDTFLADMESVLSRFTSSAQASAPDTFLDEMNAALGTTDMRSSDKPLMRPTDIGKGTQMPPVNPTGAIQQFKPEIPVDTPTDPIVSESVVAPMTEAGGVSSPVVPPTAQPVIPSVAPPVVQPRRGKKARTTIPQKRVATDVTIADAAPPTELEVTDGIIPDTFTRRVDFRNKPEDVSNEEYLIQTLVPELVSKTKLDAVDIERQLREGIQHKKGTPLDRAEWYDFDVTPEFIDAVTERAINKRAKLEAKIASGQDITPDFLDKEGIDPGEVQAIQSGQYPEYEKAVESGKANRAKYDAQLARYQSTLNPDEPKSTAALRAARDMGWLEENDAEAEIQKENDLYNRIRKEREYRKDAIYSGQETPEELNARLKADDNAHIQGLVDKYGTLGNYEKKQKELEERFKDSPMSYILKQGETAVGAAMKVPFQSASAILQTIAIGSEALERSTGGLPFDPNDPSAEKKATYKLGQDLAELAEGLKIDKDFQGSNAEIAGQVVGQVISQVAVSIATGGAGLPTLMGASQGVAGRYEQSKKEMPDIGVWERLGAAAVGGLIEAPDYLIFKGLMKGGSTVAKASLLQRIRDVVEKRLVSSGIAPAMAKKAAVATAHGAGTRMLKASTYESIQEGTTTPLNDLAAYAMYDPSPERWKKATTPTPEMFVEAAAGFFGGLVGASAVEINQRANELAKDDIPSIEAKLAELEPLLPKETIDRATKAIENRKAYLAPIPPIKMGEPRTEPNLDPQSPEYQKPKLLDYLKSPKAALEQRRVAYDAKKHTWTHTIEFGETSADAVTESFVVPPDLRPLAQEVNDLYEKSSIASYNAFKDVQLDDNTTEEELDAFRETPAYKDYNRLTGEWGKKYDELHQALKTRKETLESKQVEQKTDDLKTVDDIPIIIGTEVEAKTKVRVKPVEKVESKVEPPTNKDSLSVQPEEAPKVVEAKAEEKPVYPPKLKVPIKQKPLTKLEPKGTTVYDKVEFPPKKAATVEKSSSVQPKASPIGTTAYTIKNPPPDGYKVERNGVTGTIKKQGERVIVETPDGAKIWSPNTWKAVDAPMESARNTSSDKIIDSKGNIDYGKLENVARGIESGEFEVRRLNPEAERGRVAGGRRNVEASVILAASERSVQEASSTSRSRVDSHSDIVKRQERALETYAKHNDIWFKQGHFPERLYLGRGGEAFVYQKDEKRVVKLIDIRHIDKSMTPQKFLDTRISLFNYLFPESRYELMGFMRDANNKFRAIVTQPLIQGTEIKTQADVDAAMQIAGLEPTERESYANDLYEVHDVHIGNVLKDTKGNIFVIDAVPKFRHETQPLMVTRKGESEPMFRSREEIEASKDTMEALRELDIDELIKVADINQMTLDDGAIDMSDLENRELVRRVIGNAFGSTNMTAVFLEPDLAQTFIKTAKDLGKQADKAGYDGQKFRDLADLTAEAVKADGTAIFYIDDYAVGEEKIHRSLFFLRGEKSRLEQVPDDALERFLQSPVVDNTLNSEKAGTLGKNYAGKTKAAQMEEFAAKTVRGDWADIDVKGLEQQKAAVRVAIEYFQTFAKHNAREGMSEDEILRTMAKEFTYAEEVTEIQRKIEAEGKADVQSDKDSDEQVADGGQGETVPRQHEKYEPSGEERLSQTPKSARGKADIPLKDEPYISASNEEQQEFANKQLAKGLDTATTWFNEQVEENNLNNGATSVVGLNLLNAYAKNDDYVKMNAVAERLVPTITEAAQSVQAMRILSKFNPEMALTYAEMRKFRATGNHLTDKEVRRLSPKIEALSNVETDIEALKGAIAVLTQAEENAGATIKQLEQALADANVRYDDDIAKLKKQIESHASRPTPKKKDRAEIEARIKVSFGVMESAREELGNERFQDLIDLIALDILDYKTPTETYQNIQILTDDSVTPEQFQELQLEGWRASKGAKDFTPVENLTTEQREARDERNRRTAARYAQQRMAFNTQGKKAGPPKPSRIDLALGGERGSKAGAKKPNIFHQEIIEQGKASGYTDAEITGAILRTTLTGNKATEQWYKQMKAVYPDANQDTFIRSATLRSDVLENIKEQRLQARAEKANYTGSLADFDNQLRHKNIERREAKANLEREDTRLAKGWKNLLIDVPAEAMGLFKGLTSWGEVSYILRQGWIPLLTDTRAAIKGDWQGIGHGLQGDNALWKWTLDKAGFDGAVEFLGDHSLSMFIEKIRQHPRFLEAQNNGIRFSQIGDFNIADDHFSTKLLEGVPLYKRAEVAYTLPGDLQRLFMYDKWAKGIDESGLSRQEIREAKKYAAATINAFTGKGDIGNVLKKNGNWAKLASIVFYSPQLFLSRIESAYKLSTGFATAPKGMKLQMAKKGVRFYGLMALLMYAAGAALDPEDDDFGKVNFKKDSWLAKQVPDAKDLHLDLLSGLDVPIQNSLRLFMGLAKAAQNGDKAYAGDAVQAVWSDLAVNKSEEPRLARSKLSPGASFVVDAVTGKDYIGRPFTMWGGITSRTLPLAWQQTYDALLYDRLESMGKEPQTFANAKEKWGNEQKRSNALLMMIGTFTGMSLTQYPKDNPSKAMQLARQLSDATSKKDAETKRIEGGLRNLFKAQQEALRSGDNVGRINQEIQNFINKYPQLKKEQAKLLGHAKSETGLFSWYAQEMTLPELKRVQKLARGAELEVVNKLIKTAEKKK